MTELSLTGSSALWQALTGSSRWMAWNLFLAIVPWALSEWLFRRQDWQSRRSRPWRWEWRWEWRWGLWWLGVAAFVAFLPNAPYVLTDVIHLVREVQTTPSLRLNALVILPKYLLFMLIGFAAYVLALINVGEGLAGAGGCGRWRLPVELLLHSLSAIGVYLGRFERLNSWQLVTEPGLVLQTAAHLTTPTAQRFILLMFVITAGLYALLKPVAIALVARPLRHSFSQRS